MSETMTIDARAGHPATPDRLSLQTGSTAATANPAPAMSTRSGW